ncbi:MAG: hypothetical protein IPI35_18415 [Deltaproteobacteria bacterium]|nr:hypothetical protein [Deltaproteobacteria bacterium]
MPWVSCSGSSACCARGPLAPLSLLITTSLVAPALWASGWGRVALISGGVGLATLTAIGAALDKSRSASCLGWAWVGLGLAAMGAAAAPLGLALGLSGLGLAAMCEQTAADDPARPSPWAIGLGALAAGGVPSLGVGGGRDALLGLIVSGDPIAAAGVLLVSAATGYCLGRAPPARRSPAVLSLIAAPLVWGLSRWLSPTVAVPRVELHLVGALASAVTLGAGIWAVPGRAPAGASAARRSAAGLARAPRDGDADAVQRAHHQGPDPHRPRAVGRVDRRQHHRPPRHAPGAELGPLILFAAVAVLGLPFGEARPTFARAYALVLSSIGALALTQTRPDRLLLSHKLQLAWPSPR